MNLPRKCRCVKPMVVQRYDEDGYWVPGQAITVEPGMEFTKDGLLRLAEPPAVHLDGSDGLWIEIHPDTLKEHFEEVGCETDTV